MSFLDEEAEKIVETEWHVWATNVGDLLVEHGTGDVHWYNHKPGKFKANFYHVFKSGQSSWMTALKILREYGIRPEIYQDNLCQEIVLPTIHTSSMK